MNTGGGGSPSRGELTDNGPGRGTVTSAEPASTTDGAARVVAAIRRAAVRLRFTTEAHLQRGLAQLFAEAGIPARREARLSRRDRPDFLVGTVAIEVKVSGTPAEVRRQLARYLSYDTVTEVVLVTRCARHRELSGQLGGKPVYVVWVSGVIG